MVVISTSLAAARALSVSPYRCFSVVRRSISHQHPLENQSQPLVRHIFCAIHSCSFPMCPMSMCKQDPTWNKTSAVFGYTHPSTTVNTPFGLFLSLQITKEKFSKLLAR